jgi:probable HAF family extracellular repeat protein
MKRRPSLLLKVLLAAFLVFAPTSLFAVTVTEIVIPISGLNIFAANAINNRGQVVGFYATADLVRHCFLWGAGSFQTIDVPATPQTTCYGINNLGQIVGSYSDSAGLLHDFLWNAGTLVELNVPGMPVAIGGINDRGQIVGSYRDGGSAHCFLWERGALRFLSAANITDALCYDINNRDQIAGAFVDSAGNSGSILSGGAIIPISIGLFTIAATSINDHGHAVGLFFDNSVTRGFLFENGTAAQIALPAPDPIFQSVAINNSGDLVVTFHSFGVFPSRIFLVSPH